MPPSPLAGEGLGERGRPRRPPPIEQWEETRVVRQPLQEAHELVEGAYSLRADVLRELLQHCTSVKTVRLCLQLGREAALPWANKLDPVTLPTGSDRPWVSRPADGLLVLKRRSQLRHARDRAACAPCFAHAGCS